MIVAGRTGMGHWLWSDALRARYGLIPERPGDDHLDLAWTDGRVTIHRDVEIGVELLCEHVSSALDRLEGAVGEKPAGNVVRLRG